jgi:hypothetical protein
MNTELERLASRIALAASQSRELSLRFGLACAKRVEHLLEEPDAVALLRVLEQYVRGQAGTETLTAAAEEAAAVANRHRGSNSIDGCGHAAVSATYGVSKALQGKAVEAAQYCAYAAIYAAGGYAAVADREAFEPEYTWQVQCLQELASNRASGVRSASEQSAA